MKKITTLCLLLLTALVKAQTYSIGHTTITYTDPARAGRSIATEIYYPAATAGTGVPLSVGTFPVIVFGHGFVMAWDAYLNMWSDLVPQGYIVAFPKTEGSISPSHSEFGKDLSFLVTKLQSESATNTASLLYSHINTKSAIMGHSMGGGSSFLAAESNATITTMVTFAAANTTPSSIAAAQNVTVPTLVFSGQNDCVAPAIDHQIKMYDSLASSCKTFISINGGAHCEFANNNFNCNFGQSTCTPAPAITRAQQQDATSDFLKLWLAYYLKDNCNSLNVFNDSLVASSRITYNQQCNINSPVISQSGLVLTSTIASTYQWYLNGTLIPGATFQNYTATGPGNYYVIVTYINTCPYQSNTINLSSTDINNSVNEFQLVIYPNPSRDNIHLDLQSEKNIKVSLEIKNIMGQVLKQLSIDVIANQNMSLTYDLSAFEKGIYFIELRSENASKTLKIVKQ